MIALEYRQFQTLLKVHDSIRMTVRNKTWYFL